MSLQEKYEDFIERLRDVNRFRAINSHLSWDQQTMMPVKGREARAGILAWLASQAHQMMTKPEMVAVIEELNNEIGELDEDQACNVREAKREMDKAIRLPPEHVFKAAEMTSTSIPVWDKAREDKNFSHFESTLRELVSVSRERIEYLRQDGQTPYDVLLDDYEHGMTVADYDPLFAGLRERLVPLLAKIMESKQNIPDVEIPDSASFPIAQQEEFCLRISRSFGFDHDAGRMDTAPHPFCSGLWPGDTRITTRYDVEDPFSCIGAVMHETGHGLYEQGLPVEHCFTPRGRAISLGVHESQSRLWENQVGRSREYWNMAGAWFRESFDECPEYSDDELFRIINRAEPSFIRVEADEVTYNLHVMLRYEVEKAIFNDGMDISEIPKMWNSLFLEWFGLEVPNDTLGCLQDIHWSMMAFGYFPTYTLGNLYAAQLMEKMIDDLGMEMSELLSEQDTSVILNWLKINIHERGMLYGPNKLIEVVTGKLPNSEPFLSYVERKYGKIHGF